ncbi:3-oxoacyl-ACP synthase III family protein [Streptomyces sp. T-3]|nr:3-oxoacyl-ACP synthase III family protein [Streptomyces sp. T-3]
MRPVHIVGTGGYQPGEPITNDRIERLVGPLPDDVLTGLSIERRFWIIDPETGEHRENNSDMACEAARRALDSAGMEPGEIDLFILATGTPDYTLPPVVNLVQERLGVARCATMELRSGGAGVVQGLDIARTYLASGRFRTAMVIGSEAISPVLAPVFLGKDPESIRMRDRMPVYMFGDGAGAIALRAEDAQGAEFTDGPEGLTGGLLAGATQAIGGDRAPGIWAVGGGTHAPIHRQLEAKRLVDLKVDVVGAGDFTPVMVTDAISDTLACAGVASDSIDLCLVPEGNVGWMLDALQEAGLDTPEWRSLAGKIIDSLSTMGAVGCAAVPLFLDDAWRSGRIKPGLRVMLIGVESTKWIYAGTIVDWTAEVPVR